MASAADMSALRVPPGADAQQHCRIMIAASCYDVHPRIEQRRLVAAPQVMRPQLRKGQINLPCPIRNPGDDALVLLTLSNQNRNQVVVDCDRSFVVK